MFDSQKKGLLSNAVPTLFKKKLSVMKPVTSKNVYKTITIDDNKIPPAIPIDATTFCSKYDKLPIITPVSSINVYKTITVDDNKIPPAIPIYATTSCSKYDKSPVTTPVTSKNVNETITIDDNEVPPAIPIDPITSCSKYDTYISRTLFDTPTHVGLNSVSLQTPAYLSAKSPRKLKLKKKLSEEVNLKKQLEKTIIELRKQLEETNTENNCLKLCEMYLPSTMYLLIKNYLMNKYKSPNGQRHLNEITQFAHTIHHLGPKAYYFLQKHFSLPHMHTLKKKSVKNVQNRIQNDHRYSKL